MFIVDYFTPNSRRKNASQGNSVWIYIGSDISIGGGMFERPARCAHGSKRNSPGIPANRGFRSAHDRGPFNFTYQGTCEFVRFW
jgi:hypothetical protein